MEMIGDWLYTEKVRDHFVNPRNVLFDERDYEYDGMGITGNIKCGDQMIVFIQVDKEKKIITDCKWKTYGCASALASTSMLSEMVKGMDLDKAFNLTPKDIAEELGGLPENKIHCSVLGDKALRLAISDYYEKDGQADKVVKDEAQIVCECMEVTDHEIEEAVLEGVRTLLELQEKTKLGTTCGECKPEAKILMEEYIKKYFDD
jgi:nitrogen fixation protein NifU and related proteins